MKVCIVSDSHDHRPLLEAAVRAAKQQGAEAVLHCGDVVAASTLSVLKPVGLPVHVIHGNNTGDLYMMARIANKPGNLITFYGQDVFFILDSHILAKIHRVDRIAKISHKNRYYLTGN